MKNVLKKLYKFLDMVLIASIIVISVPVYGIIVYANTIDLSYKEEPMFVPAETIPIIHADKTIHDSEDIVGQTTVISATEEKLQENTENVRIIEVVEDEILEVPIEPEYRMEIDEKTYEVLVRVTEAEVTGERFTYKGEQVSEEDLLLSKIRVAQVFMNRVEDSNSFRRIDNLYEALTEENASATFKDGRYYEVEITDLTIKAVEMALLASTPDYTDGALFFSSGTEKCAYGEHLFTDAVGHAFFK